MYAVEVRADSTQPVSAERRLLPLPATANSWFLLPAGDGRRFVISQFGDTQQANAVHTILNWQR